MNALKLAVGTLGMAMANVVLAGTCTANCLPPVRLPMETGGLLAVAAILLLAGVKIVRQKRNR